MPTRRPRRALPAPVRWLAAAATVASLVFPAHAQDSIAVHCEVFHDLDGDGVRDGGEPPMAGIGMTNGRDVLFTDASGIVDLVVDRTEYRFVTLRIPRGYWPSNAWFRWVPVGVSGPDTTSFGLETSDASAADTVRWVHISDTQIDTWGDPNRIDVDLQEVNELASAPLFVINTGDLVEVGADSTHWQNYVSQLAVSAHPVLPVVGNHDLDPWTLDSYERYVGPPYYSFEAGNWHFVVYNSEKAGTETPIQDIWMANDLAAATPGTHRAVFQHRQLTDTPTSTVTAWDSLGVRANFSGHWHCTQFTERSNGMLDFNLSRTTRGPADRTPRVFGIVTCTDDGEVSYDLRRLAVDHRSRITEPASGQVVAPDALTIRVQAYDTSSRVSGLTATVSGPGGSLPAAPLVPEGISLWTATLDATSLPFGTYTVTVVGTFDDGAPVNLTTTFSLDDVVPIVRSPVEDWPMFRRSPAGSSFVSTPLPPPLEPAWAAPVPGMIAMSSPVVAQGKVYLAYRGETGTGGAGLACFDAVTGQSLWQTSFVGGGAALAPAVTGGRVLVNALADFTYAFDAATGAELWSTPIPYVQWAIYPGYVVSAVITDGTSSWTGADPISMQLHVADGTVDWQTQYLGTPFFPYLYSAPAIGSSHVYFSSYSLPGSGDQAFAVASRADGSIVYSEDGTFRSVIVAGETLYVVGGPDRNNSDLTARDATGAVLWTAPQTVGAGTASPALGHGVIVLASERGNIGGFRASDGLELWSVPVGPQLFDMIAGVRSGSGTIATAAIADSVAYVGSLDGNLYALDLATGVERWRWDVGAPIASSAAISGNMLFVGASDGHLHAFESRSGPVTAAPSAGGRAGVFALYAPRPNPSRGRTSISWVQPRPARTTVRVLDVGGRVVRTLVDRVTDGGEHEIAWDGTNGSGDHVAAGVYLVRVESGGERAARRIVRLR